MFRKLVKSVVKEVLGETSGKNDQAERLAQLEAENAKLKAQAENSGAAKRLAKLKEIAAGIPDGAQGMGMIAVLEDGVMKSLALKSKSDLNEVIAKAEKGELEIFLG